MREQKQSDNVVLVITIVDHVFCGLLVARTGRDVFVPAENKSRSININYTIFQPMKIRLTLVVERTLFDGSKESDSLGDVPASVGVLG